MDDARKLLTAGSADRPVHWGVAGRTSRMDESEREGTTRALTPRACDLPNVLRRFTCTKHCGARDASVLAPPASVSLLNERFRRPRFLASRWGHHGPGNPFVRSGPVFRRRCGSGVGHGRSIVAALFLDPLASHAAATKILTRPFRRRRRVLRAPTTKCA